MNSNVTLPEGVSLQRVAEVLRDAWEVGSHQWKDTPLQLQEGSPPPPPPPVPADALDLFRVLHQRRVPYLLVGGIALPSLYRQFDTDRVALYETDVTMLLSRHSPNVAPLLALVERYVEPGDVNELRAIVSECVQRVERVRGRMNAG